MPSARHQASTYIHPEFGYLCPTPSARRVLRVALIAAASGLAFGAIGAFLLLPPQTMEIRGVAETVGNSSGNEVRTAVAEQAPPAAAVASPPCSEQTWPYLGGKCLSPKHKTRHVRTFKPAVQPTKPAVQPAPSEQALLMASPPMDGAVTPEATNPAQPAASPKREKKIAHASRKKRSKARQDANSRTAYGTSRGARMPVYDPYTSRYNPYGRRYATARYSQPWSNGWFGGGGW
jgi:hypothetical protein